MANKVCEILGIEKPIIQGAMHTMTNANLVGAVSKAGGLGILGVNAGYKFSNADVTTGASQKSNEDTPTNNENLGQMESSAAINLMADQIKKVRAITDKPFGIQLAAVHENPKDDAEAYKMSKLMIDNKVPVALIGGFSKVVSKKWVDYLHDNGIKVINRSNTPTAEDTRQAVKNGADIIGATGFDEGGSIPTKIVGTFDIIPLVVDNAGDVPVVAAGGIVDARTVKAAFALGAQGVYCGTAFLATPEAPIAESIKQKMLEDDADDMLFYKAEPKYYRSLPGELPNKLVQMYDEGKSGKEIWQAANSYQGLINGMVKGDLAHGFASFGMGISFIHKIEPAAKVVDRLYAGVPKDQR